MNIFTLHGTATRQARIIQMSFLLFLNFLFIASNLLAAEISLTWDMNTESDLAGYKIYKRLLPSNDYGGAVFSGLPSNPATPRTTITNLLDSSTYGLISTAFDSSGNESSPSNETIVSTPSNSGGSGGGGGSTISVNFQPANASIPSGYQKDDGSKYTSARGYGWTASVDSRERNKHADQRLDTFVHFDRGTTVTWNYDLPNGNYLISLASGDPSYAQGPHQVTAEGITLINQQTTGANQFHTVTDHPITVSDGQLTLQLTRTSATRTLLNYVRLTPVGGSTGNKGSTTYINRKGKVRTDRLPNANKVEVIFPHHTSHNITTKGFRKVSEKAFVKGNKVFQRMNWRQLPKRNIPQKKVPIAL